MASAEVTAYFAWKKFPGNRVYRQTEDLKSFLGDRWNNLSSSDQDELLDDLFVNKDFRHLYKDEEDDSDFPPSFPKLMIPCGEKIMVDENDLRTWRDAHSGPFSWKSKSQQDLTLADFEPENMYKTPAKSKKNKSESETENEDTKEKTAPPEFVFNENRWTAELLSDYQTYLDTRTSKPTSRASSPLEEDNPAFEGSVQDLTGIQTTSECSGSIVSEQSRESPARSEMSERSRKSKSPGPKKVTFSKGKDIDDDSDEKLIVVQDAEETKGAFTNPVMANEWSTFVGQKSEETEKIEPSPAPAPIPVTSEPPSMTMDRGMERGHELSDNSVESTPDHTAKLLPSPPDIEKAEKEEVLFVAVETEQHEQERDTSSMRMSGFDFLDNW